MPMRAKILLFGILLPIATIVVLLTVTSLTFYSEKDNTYKIQGHELATEFSRKYLEEVIEFQQLFKELKSAPNFNAALVEQSRKKKSAFVLFQKLQSSADSVASRAPAAAFRAYWASDPSLNIKGAVVGENRAIDEWIFELKSEYENIYFIGAEYSPNVFLGLEMPELTRFLNDKKIWSLYLLNSKKDTTGQISGTSNFARGKISPFDFESMIAGDGLKKLSLVQSGSLSFDLKSKLGSFLVSAVGLPEIQSLWVTLLNLKMLWRSLFVVAFRGVMGGLSFIFLVLFVVYRYADRVTKDLRALISGVNRVAEGRFDLVVDVRSHDEIGALGQFFNQMMNRITFLMSETAEKARMETELKTARTVQETLFPAEGLSKGQFQVGGRIVAASECGGDWWYHFEVENQVWLWVGDATGHGVPAALLTSAARAVASVVQRSVEGSDQRSQQFSPSQAMNLLNSAIYDVSKGHLMMTFFLAVVDQTTGLMTYVNASHEPAMILAARNSKARERDFKVIESSNNPRLGESAQYQFKESNYQLISGDRLIIYTDGVFDVVNADKKSLGEREFFKALGTKLFEHSADKNSVESSIDAMVKHFDEYRAGAALIDDVTLVICKYEG
jgi:serine phosphatase RsbU (regulator of sigma subunit)